jgi:hypothetical protein
MVMETVAYEPAKIEKDDRESIEKALEQAQENMQEESMSGNMDLVNAYTQQCEYLISQLQHLDSLEIQERKENSEWWHNFWMIVATVTIAIATAFNAYFSYLSLASSQDINRQNSKIEAKKTQDKSIQRGKTFDR